MRLGVGPKLLLAATFKSGRSIAFHTWSIMRNHHHIPWWSHAVALLCMVKEKQNIRLRSILLPGYHIPSKGQNCSTIPESGMTSNCCCYWIWNRILHKDWSAFASHDNSASDGVVKLKSSSFSSRLMVGWTCRRPLMLQVEGTSGWQKLTDVEAPRSQSIPSSFVNVAIVASE